MDTSFVVIAHNEERNIGRALDSIAAQRELGAHEVIVVDDGSRDRTAEIARDHAAANPAVRLIQLGRNRGRGSARSVGVDAASGRLIATVDADIVLPEDWLERCRVALDSRDAVAGTAVPDGDVAYLCSRFGLEPRVVGHTQDVTGSNALYRRELFDSVGFDPGLRDGEDVALNYAMRACGSQMLTVDGLVVRHEEGKGLRASLAWLYQSGRGASRQLRRYRELRPPDLAFAGWLASLIGAGALAARGRRRAAPALPAGYLLLASAAHVRQKFELDPRRPASAAAAVALNTALLLAYFAGRTVGTVTER
jgi:glycosyltransferase involved in cell wall biosynthesis